MRDTAEMVPGSILWWGCSVETREVVICISLDRNSVLSGKSDKNTPDMPKVELEENLRTKHSTLSIEDFNTSN